MAWMQIAVIGEIFKDVIYPFQSPYHTGLGGILYNLLTLAQFAPPDSKLYPVSHLSLEDKETVEALVSPYPAIDLKGLLISRDFSTSKAILRYDISGTRTEEILIPNPSIGIKSIKPFLKCNGILINFTARRDIQLETLRLIHKRSPALIMADLHNLASRIDRKDNRYYSPLPSRRRWLKHLDIIQGNESEYFHLFNEETTTLNGQQNTLMKALTEGPQIAIMTLGERGVCMAWSHNNQTFFHHWKGIPVSHPIDPTGCGDVFAASFFWHYLTHQNPSEAAKFANQAAAINSTLHSLNNLYMLKKKI